ncbi:hypothetical protein [Thermomonospora cellulosilytica]|uniref:Uncharacterized protein n=1 Tax=Thermomonospora cellulosilytica TaxID=1411118 RepID=A0A7W3MUD9_9ACTN|nr:hypothetical protein [Thermomonospora cellulosilytica]MBA9002002.1 hypothetical protein [Thermomonospora cellulosilytica]
MSGLYAGTVVRALDWPPSASASNSTAQTDVSNIAFATGSPVVAVTITAPTSGRVKVEVSGLIRDNTGDNRGILAFEVYEGTSAAGTKVVAAAVRANSMTSIGEASDYMSHGRATLVEGLTPGGLYYVRLVQAVSGGTTVDILNRSLIVYPVS